MQHVIKFLVQPILAIAGAIGFAIVMVGGPALCGGCAIYDGSRCWRWWRARR